MKTTPPVKLSLISTAMHVRDLKTKKILWTARAWQDTVLLHMSSPPGF
uniref:Uncharacterized protein n=1 Tax=Arundo donax TaxID=35708 RepID=A0A0A8Z584_ARUDO